MLEPWVQYEAYDIHVANNLISDVWGAGLGVYGGLHVLMAHNTLMRVGSRWARRGDGARLGEVGRHG